MLYSQYSRQYHLTRILTLSIGASSEDSGVGHSDLDNRTLMFMPLTLPNISTHSQQTKRMHPTVTRQQASEQCFVTCSSHAQELTAVEFGDEDAVVAVLLSHFFEVRVQAITALLLQKCLQPAGHAAVSSISVARSVRHLLHII